MNPDDPSTPRKKILLKKPAATTSSATTAETGASPTRAPLRSRHLPLRQRAGQPAKPGAPAPQVVTHRNTAATDNPRTKPPEPSERQEHSEPDAHASTRRMPKPSATPETRTSAPNESAPPRRQRDRNASAPKAEPRERRSETLNFFAPCPRGLEEELAKELGELGVENPAPGHGGASFSATLPQAWKVCLWSRLAIRVLWQIDQGQYRSEDDLYRAALALPWSRWFSHAKTIAVTTVAHACPLKSLNFVTLRIKDAVCDRFRADTGERPSVQSRDPEVPIVIYLDREQYTLYLDLAGTPLNRRGYRVQPAAAPINENLAAGLLRIAGWEPGTPLLDPMMGGGTILLEAAMLALNQAPGLKRHFAFENFNGFREDLWQRLRQQAERARKTPVALPLYGLDIDPQMVHAAQANFRAASVGWCIQVAQGDALQMAPPGEHGLIITNPPYGVRLETDDMAALYKGFGDTLKNHFPGWTAWAISADPEFPKGIGLKAARRVPLYNGALECRFYRYDLVAGQHRRRPTPVADVADAGAAYTPGDTANAPKPD